MASLDHWISKLFFSPDLSCPRFFSSYYGALKLDTYWDVNGCFVHAQSQDSRKNIYSVTVEAYLAVSAENCVVLTKQTSKSSMRASSLAFHRHMTFPSMRSASEIVCIRNRKGDNDRVETVLVGQKCNTAKEVNSLQQCWHTLGGSQPYVRWVAGN